MSTLRTDTLQTTDSSFTVEISDLASKTLLGSSDLDEGISLVYGGIRGVDSIAQLRTLPKTGVKKAHVYSYFPGGNFGGGDYHLDEADTTSADNGGSIIVNPIDGGRWKLQFSDVLEAGQFGHDGLDTGDGNIAVQNAIIAMYNAGGGTVTFRGTINQPSTTNELLLYPNVKLRGAGLDKSRIERRGTSKTSIRTFRPTSGYTPVLCNAPGISGFTMNGQTSGSGNIGLDASNVRHAEIYEVNFANMQHGIYFNKNAGDTEPSFPFGQAYENHISSCQFASCANATSWRGASNSNTFTGNTYNSCVTAYAMSFANNYSETNDFYNDRVEGCEKVFDWAGAPSQIYGQNFYGLTVENPSSNPFTCLVQDPGRQNFYGLRLIPGDETGVSFYQLFPGTYSDIYGTRGSSDRYSRGTRISEEIWSIGGVRHLKNYNTVGYSATIAAGSFGTATISITGAAIGDFVTMFTDKDLGGCVLVGWVSSPNTVTVRIQNASTSSVTLTGISITALIEKFGAVGPIL